ncbi:starch-binding domain-containing protein 1 [Sphaerodactylus townsendi]|uniref:starch-binding domain-containing protein 1 n=1 Tax=Sphaerodactylus townsendi TaxID=933632 RepID=UPI002027198B|nr:starch-binding domain-containing protein 1 [Sphaerodactylus townsendi]XP_048338673.1 starch-binding domain-containing protein 1 [Sphaerodactylus townsendi]XP_048338674.1 starch-binding domain-containing protein 1 [Sphaerodactylus townsendi]
MAAGEEGGPVPGLWSALLVALVAAFVAWLWRRGGEEDPAAAAAAATPAKSGSPPGEEPLQGSYKCLASETKPNDVSVCEEPAQNLLASPGERNGPIETPETEPVDKIPVTPLMNCMDHSRNEIVHFPAAASESWKSEETETCSAGISVEANGPGDKHKERCGGQLYHNSPDHEEWEILPERSAWGDANRNSNVEDAASSKDLELAKRVAAVSPMPQTVHVTFRVHYITYSETQLLAVTGDHECLGQWHHYVPLRCDKDGFWSDSVVLPVDTRAEWKFIVVENGKVRRWEECDNRTLMTEHEDRVVHKWWGFH